MAGLSGRVRALERAAGAGAGLCPGCGGRGTPAFQVRLDGVAQGPARGCGLCGRIAALNVLCIDEPETEMATAASSRAWTPPRPGEGR